MKKLALLTLALGFSVLSYSQIEVDNSGRVGIGTAATSTQLTVGGGHNTLIRLVNGNNHVWSIGNYHTSLWGSAPNTLAIYDETSGRYLMEFRQDNTYIHDRLLLGVNYSGNQAVFELDDQKWMRVNAKNNSSGILFYETGTSTKNSVQYGGKIEYNENSDAFIIGTYQNNVAKNGIYLYRNNGSVGINGFNTSWTYKLKVFGAAYSTSYWQTSDAKLKKDIQNLTNSVQQLEKLRGVTYKMKPLVENEEIIEGGQLSPTDTMPINTDTTINRGNPLPERMYGFIAQEVQKIFPDLVYEDNDEYFAINYTGFIPLLVEAFKEQQTNIEKMQTEIEELRKQQKSGSLKGGSINSTNTDIEENTLYQNTPNPFSASTKIEYFIIDNVQNAMLNVYNMNGMQLKSIPLHQKGNGNIIINANEFTAGMYMYALIADGKVIDTKRMILTD
jgi:hypothetical protein